MRSATHWLTLGATLGSLGFLLAFVNAAQDQDKGVPARATVDGNYSELLRKIEVPQDQGTYGDFFDYGYYAATPSYAGFQDLPAGHWVYVSPHWFIWNKSKKPRDSNPAIGNLMAWNDPFGELVNKDVSLRIFGNETIKGRISENRAGFFLFSSSEAKKSYWVNKAHVSYVELNDEGKGK